MQWLQDKRLRMFFGVLVVGLIVWGGVSLVRSNRNNEEEVMPEIVLEPTMRMEAELEPAMTEQEKQVIEDKFASEGVEMTMLKDVAGGQGIGTSWRLFDGEKFYHKVEAEGLTGLEKGYFYEGWLVGDEGFFSTGRMGEVNGEGDLYYTAEEDKSGFRGVVITLEPEDGDPAPGKHVLEGSF